MKQENDKPKSNEIYTTLTKPRKLPLWLEWVSWIFGGVLFLWLGYEILKEVWPYILAMLFKTKDAVYALDSHFSELLIRFSELSIQTLLGIIIFLLVYIIFLLASKLSR